jgi:plastocyanin
MTLTSMRHVRKTLVRAILLPMAALAFGTTVHAADVAVSIDNFAFGPQRLVVPVGTSVTWTNRDDAPHTVAATGKAFRSRALDTGDTFTFTFTAPGSFDYFCTLHPHMTGTIVVEAAGNLPSP